MKLVSVIMPTYNVEKYVGEAIESILNQTYENIEFIIVDDCSSDNTYSIIEKYAEADYRIKCYRNERNMKICFSLNRALEQCSGDYIVRMDGDDISAIDRIEKMVGHLENNPEIDLMGSNITKIDEDGKLIGKKSFPCTEKILRKTLKYQSCILHIWIARKRTYDLLKGYRNIPYAEDYDFLLRGVRLGLRYANYSEDLYSVRTRNGNTGTTNGLKQRKTKKYVYELYKREKKENKDCFIREEYEKAVACRERESKRFLQGYIYLNKALAMQKKGIAFCIVVLLAIISSRQILLHLYESIVVRLYKLCER